MAQRRNKKALGQRPSASSTTVLRIVQSTTAASGEISASKLTFTLIAAPPPQLIRWKPPFYCLLGCVDYYYKHFSIFCKYLEGNHERTLRF